MKSIKLWMGTCLAIIIICLLALVLALWNNVSSEWAQEKLAAQVALNKSPLEHLSGHDVFTGAGVEDVFSGTDVFGHGWYAFVYGSPMQVNAVPAKDVLTSQQVKQKVLAMYHISARSMHLGYITSNQIGSLATSPNVVWEISGKVGDNIEYLFVDAKTSTLVWKWISKS